MAACKGRALCSASLEVNCAPFSFHQQLRRTLREPYLLPLADTEICFNCMLVFTLLCLLLDVPGRRHWPPSVPTGSHSLASHPTRMVFPISPSRPRQSITSSLKPSRLRQDILNLASLVSPYPYHEGRGMCAEWLVFQVFDVIKHLRASQSL